MSRTAVSSIAGALLLLFGPSLATVANDDSPYLKRLVTPGSADPLRQPVAVHADLHTGEIFVCDRRTNRVVIFDERGLYRYQIRGGSIFTAPTDVAVDPEGFIIVLAQLQGRYVLMQLDFDGRFMGIIDIKGAGGVEMETQLVSLALSPAGDRIYALDQANHRLWVLTRDGEVIGSTDLAEGLTEKETRDQMLGMVDAYRNTVLVGLPMAGRVVLFDPDGLRRGIVGLKGTSPCQTAFPVAGALDKDGNVVILDKQRMLFSIWSPSDNRCVGEFSHIGRLEGSLYMPADLALEPKGRI